MKQPELTPTLFTPSDAERITGLSTAMQRDWRHRGFIKKGEGHARFDCFDLAALLGQKLLADRGVGPQASSDVAWWISVGIVARALLWENAYEGDHHLSPSWLEGQDRWGFKAELLKRKFIRENRRVAVEPAPIFIWWPNGEHTFHVSFDAAIEPFASWDSQRTGAIIVLDLEALGGVLLDRAGRALVHVEVAEAE